MWFTICVALSNQRSKTASDEEKVQVTNYASPHSNIVITLKSRKILKIEKRSDFGQKQTKNDLDMTMNLNDHRIKIYRELYALCGTL